MKTSFLFIALFVISFGHLFGKIRNGYEAKLQRTKESLEKLRSQLLEGNALSFEQRRNVKAEIKKLVNYISCYELTEELIAQFKMLSPDLYDEMDTIQDRRNRITDIFIKLIPKEEAIIRLEATTSFSHMSDDEDAHRSEYGEFSVAVNIWIEQHSLQLLYHELGHIRYVVPNLASYFKFYKRYYRMPVASASYIGHHVKDKSGKSAVALERRFVVDRAHYNRKSGKKIEGTLWAMQRIRKSNRQLETPASREELFTVRSFD